MALTLPKFVGASERPPLGATRVLKPQADRQPVLRQWPMTIADVAARSTRGCSFTGTRLGGGHSTRDRAC